MRCKCFLGGSDLERRSVLVFCRYMALLAKRSPSAAIEWFDKGGGTKAGGPAAVAGKVQHYAFEHSLFIHLFHQLCLEIEYT